MALSTVTMVCNYHLYLVPEIMRPEPKLRVGGLTNWATQNPWGFLLLKG